MTHSASTQSRSCRANIFRGCFGGDPRDGARCADNRGVEDNVRERVTAPFALLLLVGQIEVRAEGEDVELGGGSLQTG